MKSPFQMTTQELYNELAGYYHEYLGEIIPNPVEYIEGRALQIDCIKHYLRYSYLGSLFDAWEIACYLGDY